MVNSVLVSVFGAGRVGSQAHRAVVIAAAISALGSLPSNLLPRAYERASVVTSSTTLVVASSVLNSAPPASSSVRHVGRISLGHDHAAVKTMTASGAAKPRS